MAVWKYKGRSSSPFCMSAGGSFIGTSCSSVGSIMTVAGRDEGYSADCIDLICDGGSTPPPPTYYYVHYYKSGKPGEGGSTPSSTSRANSGYLTLSTNRSITRTGFNQTGWSTSSSGSSPYSMGASVYVSSNRSMYPAWSPNSSGGIFTAYNYYTNGALRNFTYTPGEGNWIHHFDGPPTKTGYYSDITVTNNKNSKLDQLSVDYGYSFPIQINAGYARASVNVVRNPITYSIVLSFVAGSGISSAGALNKTSYNIEQTPFSVSVSSNPVYSTGYGQKGYTLNRTTVASGATGTQTFRISAAINTYTGTFTYYNGVNNSRVFNHGTSLSIPSVTPSTAQYSYAWNSTSVSTTANFTRSETRSTRSYLVNFMFYNGGLANSKSYSYGTVPTTPSGTASNSFFLYRWPSISAVSGVATYTETRVVRRYGISYSSGGYGSFSGSSDYPASTSAQTITVSTWPSRTGYTPSYSVSGPSNPSGWVMDPIGKKITIPGSSTGEATVSTSWTENRHNLNISKLSGGIQWSAISSYYASGSLGEFGFSVYVMNNATNFTEYKVNKSMWMASGKIIFPNAIYEMSTTRVVINNFHGEMANKSSLFGNIRSQTDAGYRVDSGAAIIDLNYPSQISSSIDIGVNSTPREMYVRGSGLAPGYNTATDSVMNKHFRSGLTATSPNTLYTNINTGGYVWFTRTTNPVLLELYNKPTRTGYTFNTIRDLGQIKYNKSNNMVTIPGYSVTSNPDSIGDQTNPITLNFTWDINKSTISWIRANGAIIGPTLINYNESSTAPSVSPQNEFNIFSWPQSTYKAPAVAETKVIHESHVSRNYTTTVATGTQGTGSFTGSYRSDKTTPDWTSLPGVPTSSNYHISGWSSTNTAQSNIATINTTNKQYRVNPGTHGNITLTPIWTGNPVQITLDANGGSKGSVDKVNTVYGTSITSWSSNMIPRRTGYTFAGYYTAKTGGTLRISSTGSYSALSSTTYASNVTLYARWTINKYTYSFKTLPAGTNPIKVDVLINGVVVATDVSTYSGSHDFGSTFRIVRKSLPNGWKEGSATPGSATGISLSTNTATVLEGTLTVEANAVINYSLTGIAYSITYNLDGASGGSGRDTSYVVSVSNQTKSMSTGTSPNGYYPSNLTTTGSPSGVTIQKGSTSGGWYKDISGTITIPANTYGNVVINVVHTKKPYTVIWKKHDGTVAETEEVLYLGTSSAPTGTSDTGVYSYKWPISSIIPNNGNISGSTYSEASGGKGTYTINETRSNRQYTYTITRGSYQHWTGLSSDVRDKVGTYTASATGAQTFTETINTTQSGIYSVSGVTASTTTAPTSGTPTYSYGTANDNNKQIKINIPAGTYGNFKAQVSGPSEMIYSITYNNPKGMNTSNNPSTYGARDSDRVIQLSYTYKSGYSAPTTNLTYSGPISKALGNVKPLEFTIPGLTYGDVTINVKDANLITYNITTTRGKGITAANPTPTSYNVETPTFTTGITGITYSAGYQGFTTNPSNRQISVGSTGHKNYEVIGTPKTITITLNKTTGVSGSITSITAIYGESITAWSSSMKPSRSAWTFNGYWTASSGGTMRISPTGAYTNLTNTTYTSNATLYAQWLWNYEGISYNILGVGTGSDQSYNGSSTSSITKNITLTKNTWETWNNPTVNNGATISNLVSNDAENKQTFTITIPSMTFGDILVSKKTSLRNYNITLVQVDNTIINLSRSTYTYSTAAQTASITYTGTSAGYTAPTSATITTNSTGVSSTISGLTLNITARAYGNIVIKANSPNLVTYNLLTSNGRGIASSNISPKTYNVEQLPLTPVITATHATGYEKWVSSPVVSEIPFVTIGHRTYSISATPIKYTISYNLNGGVNNNGNPSTYDIETNDITLLNPVLSGYTFAGWYDNSTFSGSKISMIPKGSHGNKTFYARWTQTITFNSKGGTAVASLTANKGNTIARPTNPTLNRSTILGWSRQNANMNTNPALVTWPLDPKGNTTLYASWLGDEYSINLIVNNNGVQTTHRVDTYRFNKDVNRDIYINYDFMSLQVWPALKVPVSWTYRGSGVTIPNNKYVMKLDKTANGVIEIEHFVEDISIGSVKYNSNETDMRYDGGDNKIRFRNRIAYSDNNVGYYELITDTTLPILPTETTIKVSVASNDPEVIKSGFENITYTRQEVFKGQVNQYKITGPEYWSGRTVLLESTTGTIIRVMVVPSSYNILVNPNYENIPDGYTGNMSGWGGDTGYTIWNRTGGFEDRPYRTYYKTGNGSGGIHVDEHYPFTLESGKTYTVSSYMKSNYDLTLNGYIMTPNRISDNYYIPWSSTNPDTSLAPEMGYPKVTTDWEWYYYTFTVPTDRGGDYKIRSIIYDDSKDDLNVSWCGIQLVEGDITKTKKPIYTP